MIKFNRNYRMEIEDKEGTIHIIEFPLTCDFVIERNTLAGFNTAEFTIFNLSEETRNLLVRNAISFSDTRTIKWYAGYGEQLVLVFSGYVQICNSTRDKVDWMTNISCHDPGPLSMNANISVSLNAGSFQSNNVQNLVKDFMAPIQFGKIGNLFNENPTLLRGNSFSGSVTSVIKSITNGNFFIDNGLAYVLAPHECQQDQGFTTIDSSTGLLGSPSYEETFVNCEVVFEPRVVAAQQLTLDCDQKYLNGDFKLVAFSHRGRISGSVGGDAVTSLSLYNPLNSQGLAVLQ